MWRGIWNHRDVQFKLVGNTGNGDCLFDSINNANPIARRIIHNYGDETDVVLDQHVVASRASLSKWLTSKYEEYQDSFTTSILPSTPMYALSMEMLNVLELYWLSPSDLEHDRKAGVRQEAEWASNVFKETDIQKLFKVLFEEIPSSDTIYLQHLKTLLDEAGFENSDYKAGAIALWNEYTTDANIELFKLLANDPGRLDQNRLTYLTGNHNANMESRVQLLDVLMRRLLLTSVAIPFLDILSGRRDEYKYYPSQYIAQAIAIQLGIRVVIWSPKRSSDSMTRRSIDSATTRSHIPEIIFKYDFHDYLGKNYTSEYRNNEGDSLVALEHFPVVHLFLTGDHFQTLIPITTTGTMSSKYSLEDIGSLYKSPRRSKSSSRGTSTRRSASKSTTRASQLDTRQMSLRNDIPIPLITIEHPERVPSVRSRDKRGRFSHYRSRARSALRRHEGKLALTGAALLGGAAYARGGGIAGPIAATALGVGTYAAYKAYGLVQIVKNFFHAGLTRNDVRETKRETNNYVTTA